MIPKTETPKSSNIAWFSFENGVLTVEFKRGNRYDHHGVPEEEAQRMLTNHKEGGSVGSFYSHYIRGKYDTKKVA